MKSPVSAENTERDGEVETGAFLFDVGGREVDGDEGGRNQVAGVFDGGADAVAALAHGGVGESDGVEVVLIGNDTALVDFDIDQVGINAVDGSAKGLEEHGFSEAESTGIESPRAVMAAARV